MKLLFLFLVPIILLGHGKEIHEEKSTIAQDVKVDVIQKVKIQKDEKEIFSTINTEYIKNIKPIFETKCFDCHSDKTIYPWYFKLPLVSTMIQKDIDEAKKTLRFYK